jgi:hypothetical protein
VEEIEGWIEEGEGNKGKGKRDERTKEEGRR